MYRFEIPKEWRGRATAIIVQDASEVMPDDFDGTLFGIGIIGSQLDGNYIDLLILLKVEPENSGGREAL